MCKMKARFQSLSEALRNRLGYTFLAASSDIGVGEKQYHLIAPARESHRAERPVALPERGKACFWSDAKYLETILDKININHLD